MHWGAFLILTALVASGCAGATPTIEASSPTTSAAPSTTEAAASEAETSTTATLEPDPPQLPVTVIDHLGDEITIDSIERIIPLDGTVAEVVFALGLGEHVVATDLSATYPPEADALPEIGYQRSLSAESIAQFAPTVLLATNIAGPEGTIDDLRRLGYPLVIVPNEATMHGPAAKVRAVAEALGIADRGEVLAAGLDATIADSQAPPSDEAPVVVALYLRGQSTQLVLGRESATHWLIEAAGGVDAAELLDIDETTPVNAEAILALEPDIILVPSAGLDSVGGIEGLMNIGGLSETPAGRRGAVITHDDQLLLGNGPRSGELLAELRSAFEELYP